jgi:hypothetical protein
MNIRTEQTDLTTLTSDQLKKLYHKINSQLAQNLLNGKGLQAETERIQMLNKISEELNRRNVAAKII